MILKAVQIDGGAITYLEAGSGDTLVYLHGAGGRPPAGATFVSELAKDFRVLVPSRPGFDESPVGPYTTLTGAAEAMASFTRNVAAGPVHVVAQSAGGAVGLWLAVLHPDLVASLILSAPAAFAHRHPQQGGGAPRSPDELDRILYGDSPSWSSPPNDYEQPRIRRNAAFNMQHFGGDNADLLERLAEVKVPVLLIWGTEDRLVPPDGSGIYQKHMPHALRMFIHGAAHELPIAATQQWAALVRDFIQRGEFFVVNTGRE
jgi:pimeloyl-ACP methyl ester carboxylesterase